MTDDDIIRMARETSDQSPREDWNTNAWVFGDDALKRFAEKVAAAEREACAKVCDDWPNGRDDVCLLADAIRARGEK